MVRAVMSHRFVANLMCLILLLNFKQVKSLQFTTIASALENVYSFDISGNDRHVFVYNISESDLYEDPVKNSIKIIVAVEHNLSLECPLIVSVTQDNSVVSWNIGATKKDLNRTAYKSVERTICMDFKNENNSLTDQSTMFTIEISTCSNSPIGYTVSAHLRRDFLVPIHKSVRAEVIPTSPAVYRFQFPDCDSDFAFIQLTSTSDTCMIMSIQQPQCPIFDQVDNIEAHGSWQSVTTKTGMSIPKSVYPNGFFLVFLLLPDDSKCRQLFGVPQPDNSIISQFSLPRRKTINFLIRDDLPKKGYHMALFIPLGFFLTYTTVIFVIHLHFHRIRCHLYCGNSNPKNVNPLDDCKTGDPSADSFSDLSIKKRRGSTNSMLRSRIRISELINAQPERLMEQSKRYYMAGLLVASFYCVPVFQLILSFHKRLEETGNFDLCYFNYLCSHMLGMFHDFNHIYSNIGYLICGVFFIGIVYLRQQCITRNLNMKNNCCCHLQIHTSNMEIDGKIVLQKEVQPSWIPKAPWDISKGVFVHHGLFYAMGFSLLMTGLMSAGYHICPNQNNFQFDTAFMYTIAALGIVTIYQFRHPTYVSASLTFMTLAIVAASTVLGLLWENTTFRVFFTISHFAFLLVILTYIHYVGYIRTNGVTVTEWRKMFHILRQKWTEDVKCWRLLRFQRDIWSPEGEPRTVVLPGPCRLIFPILVIGVNAGALTMIWTVMQQANFASQVLAVYVINSSVYTIYYSVMKVVHYECRGKLWFQPLIYLVISLCLWAYSLSYFGDVVTLWERSPAESRARNAECIFLGFYDTHDVWHFISAAALFSSLMTLLTMDDDLINHPKSMIPVF